MFCFLFEYFVIPMGEKSFTILSQYGRINASLLNICVENFANNRDLASNATLL